MNCYLMTFRGDNDPTYKQSFADFMIKLRSKDTHSEFRFSERYGGVSASATMADDCRGGRIKNIDFTKHPLRWKSQVIEMTDAQEDRAWKEACRLVDVTCAGTGLISERIDFVPPCMVFHGPNAMKYDLIGVVMCNILPARIIKSRKNRMWCSEFCCHLIKLAYPLFNGYADTQTPESLSREWAEYRRAA